MQKIIAANWKMFKTRPQAAQTAAELALALRTGTPKGRLAVVFAPFTDIAVVADAVAAFEARDVFGETDALVARKTAYGLEKGFKVMLCVGETLEEREAGRLGEVLGRQLRSALEPLAADARAQLAGNFAIA